MQLAEIFYSVQGEGRLVGIPSVFIRTSGCNLRCVWCDTPYTSWAPEGKKWSVTEILGEVAKYPSRHIVVTGGEPFLAAEIEELTTRVRTWELTLRLRRRRPYSRRFPATLFP